MQDLAFPNELAPLAACAEGWASNCGSVRPSIPAPPTYNTSRRDTPSHIRLPAARKTNIRFPPWALIYPLIFGVKYSPAVSDDSPILHQHQAEMQNQYFPI